MSDTIAPVRPKERHVILDALRGIALLGIILANYPEFSLYTFLPGEVTGQLSTAGIDTVVKYLQYIFIDGKFYTLFSLLFGIGFSIILTNNVQKKRNGIAIFYRRMWILFGIGLFHLVFLWAGDILILYAFAGFFLPLFRNLPGKKLLTCAVIFLFLPVVIEVGIELFNWNLAAPAIHATGYFHNRVGITEENFPVWLVEKDSYWDIIRFNLGGSFIWMQEFIDGHRLFKVLGLFLLGYYIGRKRLYIQLEKQKELLKKVGKYGFIIGFPFSLVYAWSAMNSYPAGAVFHSLLYFVSVVPLSLAYITAICLYYTKNRERAVFRMFAAPGRMALTNYLMQSVIGILIFYGVGFRLGAHTGLIYVELIATVVFLFQVIYSYAWLRRYSFGPLEWCWRLLTYGRWQKSGN